MTTPNISLYLQVDLMMISLTDAVRNSVSAWIIIIRHDLPLPLLSNASKY